MATQEKKCPYEILGVPRDASDEDIKKAYRRQAIIHHPDKNQGSQEATVKFQQISAAYAILSCAEKRSRYDMTGSLDEDGVDFEPDMDDVMQIFSQFFGDSMGFGGGHPHVFFQAGNGLFSGGNVSYSNLFEDEMSMFEVFGDDEFDQVEELEDLLADGELFLQEFVEPQSPSGLKCTVCKKTFSDHEVAEEHFYSKHDDLPELFLAFVQETSPMLDDDLVDLFRCFSDLVKSGKLMDKRKKNAQRRRRKNLRKQSKNNHQKPPQTFH